MSDLWSGGFCPSLWVKEDLFRYEGFNLIAEKIKFGNMGYLCIRLNLPKADMLYNLSSDINYQILKLQIGLESKIFMFVSMTL
jgi:hypothetical protein